MQRVGGRVEECAQSGHVRVVWVHILCYIFLDLVSKWSSDWQCLVELAVEEVVLVVVVVVVETYGIYRWIKYVANIREVVGFVMGDKGNCSSVEISMDFIEYARCVIAVGFQI
jgi:low affinity Fe/Cu permease